MMNYQSTPPGWYPNQEGQRQWWNGTAWQKQTLQRPEQNSKLTALGHLSWVLSVLGLIVALVSGGSSIAVTFGLTLLGSGLTLLVVWLGVGAIVDEIRKHN